MAGVVVWWRRRDPTSSGLIAGIGLGSIAFHGPMPSWGEFVHDISIVLALVWVALVEIGRPRWWPWGIAVATGLAVAPVVADPAQAVLALATVTAIALVSERRSEHVCSVMERHGVPAPGDAGHPGGRRSHRHPGTNRRAAVRPRFALAGPRSMAHGRGGGARPMGNHYSTRNPRTTVSGFPVV